MSKTPPANDIQKAKSKARKAKQILSRVQRGELTPADAESLAKNKGLPPFSKRPDPAIFDPASSLSWTPLQSVAWIAYRDLEEVRNVSTEFRKHWFIWRSTPRISELMLLQTHRRIQQRAVNKEEETRVQNWRIELAGPASFEAFADPRQRLLMGLKPREAPLSIGAEFRKIESARATLWQALTTKDICATGLLDGDRHRSVIPAIEWNDLTFAPDAPDTLYNGQGLAYKKVLLDRSEVLELWQDRQRPGDVLLEAARRSSGTLTQKVAVKIARETGVYSSRQDVRDELRRLGIAGKQGRRKKPP